MPKKTRQLSPMYISNVESKFCVLVDAPSVSKIISDCMRRWVSDAIRDAQNQFTVAVSGSPTRVVVWSY